MASIAHPSIEAVAHSRLQNVASCCLSKQIADTSPPGCAGVPFAPGAGMFKPVFGLDVEARRQIRETRDTLLEALRNDPDDFRALVIADVLGEIDYERDPALAAHRMRFRATRAADWPVRARALGLDRLLFHLANGWRESRIGADAIPVLERRAAEIGEARPPGVELGTIDASYIPAELAGAVIGYHASGHLRRVAVAIDALHHGELVLAERPGTGELTLVEKRGGYGTMIREVYRDGRVVTTLNSPWHDGEESIDAKPWTRWVEENLADLARLATTRHPRRRRRRR